jgi:hypothetical protein
VFTALPWLKFDVSISNFVSACPSISLFFPGFWSNFAEDGVANMNDLDEVDAYKEVGTRIFIEIT